MHNVPVVSAIVLHANQLSHTDLKPENILFVDSEFEVIDVIRPGKSKKVNMLSMLFIQSVAITGDGGGFLRRLAPNSVANDKINSDGENQEFRKAEFNRLSIGVDLAGILGDAWQAPKVGRWRVGCPLPSRLGDLGASWTPPAGFGTEPRPKTKWHEGHRTLLFVPDKIRGEQVALASPTPNSGGLVPTQPATPVIYAHACVAAGNWEPTN